MAKNDKQKKAASSSSGPQDAIVHKDLRYDPGPAQETSFTRADLVFDGVDHAQDSYEVRVFLNNRKANEKTARSPETGYAGRFVVFGHGRCFGAEGHCESGIAVAPRAQAVDPAGGRQHPLTRQTRFLTITEPLRRVLSRPGKRLETLTMVPVVKTPRRDQRGLAAGLFKCDRISLRTYR